MRIYDLAKEIGQKLSIDVKPAKLAEEFKTMPEFAEIHETIRSHASSVDDHHADRMLHIYMERQGRKGQPAASAAPAPTPAAPTARAASPQPVHPQPAAPQVAPRQPLPTVRPAAPPRPAPIQPPSAHRPVAPIPAVRRPAPILAPGSKPAAPAEQPAAAAPAQAPVAQPAPVKPTTPVTPSAPVTPVTPATPAASTAPTASTPPAAPAAPAQPVKAAPVQPVAAQPAQLKPAAAQQPAAPGQPATPVRPVAPGQPAPARQAAASQPTPAQAATPGQPAQGRPAVPSQGAPGRPAPAGQPIARTGGMPPSGGQRPGQQGGRPDERRPQQQGGRGGQPQQGGNRSQKFRPTGLASELRSSSGTTGISVTPDSEKNNPAAKGRNLMQYSAGQPAKPAMPKFSTDSPFVKPPTPPRRPETRTERGERPERPERPERGGDRPDRGGYDRGPRPDRGGRTEYVDRGPRPAGDRPDRGPRPMGDRPDRGGYDRGPRPGGPDRGPRPGGPDRGPRPGGPDRGPRPGGPDRGPRPAGDRPAGAPGGRGRKEDAPLEITTVPEIGVMKLKPAKRRQGEKRHDRPETAEEKKARLAKQGKAAVKPSKVYGDADEFRRPLKSSTKRKGPSTPTRHVSHEPAPAAVGPVILTGPVTVGAFAEKLGVPTSEIIKRAFMKGKAITINQLINLDLAEELAFDMEIDLQVQLETEETDIADYRIEDRAEDMVPRAPVVTIMGHVDHGKTTVLDYYRRSQVVEGEFGGITQHIGAYHVSTSRGDIVFLDTPGHEAFTSMRARGAQCTDIVVLVVSADDGVMPQTVEAINHAKAAGVPIIVAINKIDLPQANPERVRQELLQYSVVPTSLGGDVEFVEISAKKGINMDSLLEIISLQAEVMELKGNPNRAAEGVVIESHVDPLRGATATVLVQKGTLKIGDIFVVGQQHGRVRAMLDDHGRPMQEALPGQPCELIGLTGSPDVGELFLVMDEERKAREIAERREERRRLLDLGTTRHVTLEGLRDMISEGQIKELNVILKADVQGSVEAISQSLDKLAAQEIRIRVLHSGTGSITESDVNLAMASSAIIIGFNIRPEPGAADLAQREGVEIKLYRIIYELLEDIEKAMVGMLEKKFSEHIQGRTEIRQVFRVSKVGTVAGCYVVSGEIQRNALCRLLRDGKIVYTGKVDSLRRVKDDVAKVAQGFECGVMLEKFQDVKEGDIIETYVLEEMTAELTRQA